MIEYCDAKEQCTNERIESHADCLLDLNHNEHRCLCKEGLFVDRVKNRCSRKVLCDRNSECYDAKCLGGACVRILGSGIKKPGKELLLGVICLTVVALVATVTLIVIWRLK